MDTVLARRSMTCTPSEAYRNELLDTNLFTASWGVNAMSGNAATMARSIETTVFFIINGLKMTCTALHITAPGIVGAMVQVVEITLVGIGLALKRDIAVGIAAHG